MFIASRHTIGLPPPAARARLANLVTGSGLHRASHTAYQHGLDVLIRVGPLGDAPLTSKLVAVRFLEPVERDGVTTVGLRWEATGPAAGLFPVLDANLTLTPEGEDRTELAVTGTYRAPFGRVGAALDKALLHRLASMTMAALLTELAAAITSPATAAEPSPEAATLNPEELSRAGAVGGRQTLAGRGGGVLKGGRCAGARSGAGPAGG